MPAIHLKERSLFSISSETFRYLFNMAEGEVLAPILRPLYLDNIFEMPDKMVAMLIRFLEQNNGTLSKIAQEREFKYLTSEEIEKIEKQYKMIFEKE